MKEHEVNWDQLQDSLQELEASVDIQKQVANAIGTCIFYFAQFLIFKRSLKT